jgi:hypothetical protein
MLKLTQFVKCGNYVLLKKPLLIQEEDRGEQGLEGTANLHNHNLRSLIYNNYPSVSIVVTTYFSGKVILFARIKAC